MANDLADVPAIDALLGAPSGLSPGILDAAVQAVRRYCRWHVAPVRTETFDRVDSAGLILRVPSLHLTSVIGVAERIGGTLGAPVTSGLDWTEAGLVCRPGGFPAGWGRWSVEVEHGYDVEDVPDLLMVVAQLAQRMQRAQDAAATGGAVAEEQIGQYRYRLADKGIVDPGTGVGLTLAETEWIGRYRLTVEP